jgi:hypothetical protein
MPVFTEVQPPRSQAANTANLLASAEQPTGEGDWLAGFAWRSDTCPAWDGFNPCAEITDPPSLGNQALNYVVPVGYRVTAECSTMSGEFDVERARRQAEQVTSFVLARELWTGELSAQDPYDIPNGGPTDQVNPHLASPAAATLTAATDPAQALATLEYETAQLTAGGPVFLHTTTDVIGTVADRLERIGNELRTKTGAVVIPDPGYLGTGPDGTGAGWMYGTGPVVARLGTIAADVAPASTVDRPINSRRVIAERLFAVSFDPCVHLAIQVTGA